MDEAYADFAETNCISLVEQHANVIVTRTLSKAYSLAGLRLGYAIAQPPVIAQMMKVKQSYNCDLRSQSLPARLHWKISNMPVRRGR